MINLLVVDDVRLYREGLAHILKGVDGITVLAVASGGDETVMCACDLRPDVVLLRIAMPGSLDTIRAIAATAPAVKIVVTQVSEVESEVIDCVEAGAAGYLPRDGSLEDLIVLLQRVARGEAICSPRVTASLLRRIAALAAERRFWKSQAHLTPRELEIVRLIDRGFSNKEIAQHLTIAIRTVKSHVHNMLEKLQVHRRGQAAARMRGIFAVTPGTERIAAPKA